MASITELSPWLFVLAIFILVDVAKVYIEIWNRPARRSFSTDLSSVTALIATRDGRKVIGETIHSLLALGLPCERILVVDDGSTDGTVELLRSLGVRHYSIPNMGKVSAINFGIHRVTTEFVLLLDDDTRIGAARIPTGLLGEHDAVAFNVVPDRRDRHGPQGSNLLSAIQRYEYCKSMEIGRRFQDGAASIACVSGAIGLFKTNRLAEHHHIHRGAFEGEDLERTLIEHLSRGQVVFVDERVWTVVPDTANKLLRQRLLYWYPAHYHMFKNYLTLLFRKGIKLRLRYEMAYNIYTVVLEPLRIYSLFRLVADLRLIELGVLYLLYFLLEIYPFFIVRQSLSLRKGATVLFVFPVYNIINMGLRQAA
ncbi:MAG: glycosyltransferase family 2 protein, partial [Gemmatimonadota bacterium]|nr:glycosyltransferase family 2 protein [Gemmatimonadota bacterium]